jgi:hemin uptake protein HemP
MAGSTTPQRRADRETEIPASSSTSSRRLVRSEDLFGPANEVEIAHADVIYRLRITRQGKLILNK